MTIVENVLILNKPQAEQNFATINAIFNIDVYNEVKCFKWWRSGAVVRASDFGPRGPRFEPRPVHISLWP